MPMLFVLHTPELPYHPDMFLSFLAAVAAGMIFGYWFRGWRDRDRKKEE